MSEIGQIDWPDVIRAAVSSAIVAVVYVTYNMVMGEGFSFFHVNWQDTLDTTMKAAYLAFTGSIVKRFLSNEDGKFLGKI